MQISPGGQGFRSDLPNSTWYNNGLTGEDYVGLMSIPEIAFGTVHFCEALAPPAFPAVLRRPAPACMASPEDAAPLRYVLQYVHAMRFLQCAAAASPSSVAAVACSTPSKEHAGTHKPDAPADPSNWGFPSSVVQTFGNDFLEDRALAAQAVGKPWVLEETGCNVGPAILL